MSGMKEGAGEDPFADDESNERSSDTTDTSEHDAPDDVTDRSTDSPDQDSRQVQIPYKFRRDGVQDGRTRVPLFLKDETQTAERDALREMEDRFGDNVSLTDLREALVLVGFEHLDEVEAQLEEWGYGLTFDE